MEHNTQFHLKTKQEVKQSQPIQTQRGKFQGDFLSPLLFCIAPTPLTTLLKDLIVDIKYMKLRGK